MPVALPEPLPTLVKLVLETNKKYNQDSLATLAAALAYHSFFSIFPFLLFIIYFGAHILSAPQVYDLLTTSLVQVLPAGSDTIFNIVTATMDLRGSIGLVGLIGLIWSSSSVFTVLETALNRIWQSPPRPYLRKRLMATTSILVLIMVFLMVVTLGQLLPRLLGLIQRPSLAWLSGLLTFVVLSIGITIFYTTFPSRRISRRAALLGGVFATVALLLARFIFDLLLNSTFVNYGAVYGSLALFVSLALWAYVVGTLFLIGAELGSVIEREYFPDHL